jgi:deoxyribodipyrimidine photo-lyase
LVLCRGPALEVLRKLAAETGASTVHWNTRYEPAAQKCSAAVTSGLHRDGIQTVGHNGSLLSDPSELRNQSGRPYQVYTAFQRSLLHELDPGRTLPLPRQLRPPRKWPEAVRLESLGLLPQIKWYATLAEQWHPGEAGALARLSRFLDAAIDDYPVARDIPSVRGTSGLSPHLHFGELGPRQIWQTLGPARRNTVFLKEIVWREFAYHLLHHFPQTPTQPLHAQFAQFPWKHDAQRLRAWQRGLTGIPLVDAGMRELWATGWMHNRVRMVVGSMLVKNLLVPWQAGAHWFWDTLVDADLANNTLNWQWVAGCGADAAPYFRIFNPLTQAKRFDPRGEYIKRWVPELQSADRPYPQPIVDLKASREQALEAYDSMRRGSEDHGSL